MCLIDFKKNEKDKENYFNILYDYIFSKNDKEGTDFLKEIDNIINLYEQAKNIEIQYEGRPIIFSNIFKIPKETYNLLISLNICESNFIKSFLNDKRFINDEENFDFQKYFVTIIKILIYILKNVKGILNLEQYGFKIEFLLKIIEYFFDQNQDLIETDSELHNQHDLLKKAEIILTNIKNSSNKNIY